VQSTVGVLDRREERPDSPREPITASWLGQVDYRDAWDLQKRLARARADDLFGDQLLLLEHPAVLTLGKHADESHVRVAREHLEFRGIEVVRVERGGEVTYHGPGQLVAYPILALSRRGLLLRPLVRALEGAMADTARELGVEADRRDGHPGCWCDPDGARPRKIGALGLRVERGVSYHGIALNVSVDLADFELIDACGDPGTISTSIALEAGQGAGPPATESVEQAARIFARRLADRLVAALEGPGTVDPGAARARLEAMLAMAT
jgi:lipoyl(octanoyl) transferase